MPEIMGGGVAFLDYDGDGDQDVYATNGTSNLPDTSQDAEARNALFALEADGRYQDVTAESGLGDPGYGMGVAAADWDNDGHLDVYLTNFGPDRLYVNQGDGTFRDGSAAAGLGVDSWSSSAAFFDQDRDGYLDLFVARYVAFDPDHSCFDPAGRPDYCGPKEFVPLSDVLLANDGGRALRDVSAPAGIAATAAAGLGVVCEDLNEDGWPDVYVANDAYANNLWINDGAGRFRDEALLHGVAVNLGGQPEAGMGVVADDLDGDGRVDLFLTHLNQETNTLYRNLGGSRGFRDTTGTCGLGPSSMPFTGFGTVALDLECDGDLDLAIANGRVLLGTLLPETRLAAPWAAYAEPNLVYLGDGRGGFAPAGDEVREFRGPPEISRGLAAADYDGDGDLDLLLGNVQGPLRLFRNDAPRKGHWLVVRALDPRLHRDAIGARVTVSAGGRRFVRTVRSGSSYLSSSSPLGAFGLGDQGAYASIEVHWPDGLAERFPGGSADRSLLLERGEGVPLR